MDYLYLRETFEYVDGWLVKRATGQVHGSIKDRYVKLKIEGKWYFAHRLIWLYFNGDLPDYIDHIDGNGFNNRIENLRECTQTQNLGNADWGDLRGIEQRGNSFRVRVVHEGCRYNYGSFNSLEKAKQIRDEAYILHFGEFARVPQ